MAIYNKFRPNRFGEIIGQEPVIAILKGQATKRKFHHAYLFFGSSGTGKTTCARILASVLNCYNIDGDGEPCGKCQSCITIVKGQNWDVREIDGAHFRGIDDMKALKETILYAPFGNKKVIIIDEVHMLTEQAFNSILKSVEEPPPHIVFIFCTTQVDRIPITIKSRCMCFPFVPLKPADIKRKLQDIARLEGIIVEDKNLVWATEMSAGNLRSAENILEQLQYCK